MNSRIRTPFYIFFLNPVYVAARSLRLLRNNNKEYPPKCYQGMGIFTPGEQRNTEYRKLNFYIAGVFSATARLFIG